MNTPAFTGRTVMADGFEPLLIEKDNNKE